MEKKRLCLFSIYDADGQIDEYIYCWLREFKTVCSHIITISNGKLKPGHRLCEYATQVIERPNTGFDGGAYADVLLNYLKHEEIGQYDELVLCNDTCYGPFIPMKEIFGEMEKRECDFWGIHHWDEGYADWINSFFLAFRKNVIMDKNWYEFFKGIPQESTNMADAYGLFEFGINKFLRDNNYSWDVYAKKSQYHMMKCPDHHIEKCNLPFMKRRSFCAEHYHENNILRALYLAEENGYNVSQILCNAGRKYELTDSVLAYDSTKKYECDEVFSLDVAEISKDDIISFINRNNDRTIYIYGAGAFGSRLYMEYKEYINDFGGFVVTKKNCGEVLGEEIYEIGKIDKTECAFIMGMDKANTRKVIAGLNNKVIYLQLYNDI